MTKNNPAPPSSAGGAKLERKLNPMNVWALAFGCIIGWGAFINPGKKFLPTSGTLGSTIALAGGALVMIIIAFSYSYMVPKFPLAGGEFTFTKASFGKTPAFICGWFLVIAYLANVPMNSTALGLIMNGLFGPVLKFGYLYTVAGFEIYIGEILFAFFILILFALFSVIGVKIAGIVQTILATLLAVSVITLTIAALCRTDIVKLEHLNPLYGYDKVSLLPKNNSSSITSGIIATFAIAPWAFVGFDTIPQAAEEFNFKTKKVNVIMIIAILFGGFVYIANNLITAAVSENYPEMVTSLNAADGWPLLESARLLLGNFGAVVVGIAVLCAVLSGIMGFYMASSRLMYSMSKDGYLPAPFSKVSNRFKTPYVAILFCMIVSLSGPLLGREALGWFVDMSAIGAAVGFGCTCLSTIVTMRRENEKKIGLAILAALGSLFSIGFVILLLFPIPGLTGTNFCWQSYIMFGVWVVFGALFYLFKNTGRKSTVK